MNKFAKFAVLLFVVVLVLSPLAVFAQDGASADAGAVSNAVSNPASNLTGLYGVGCGLILIGAGYGIGKIGSSSVESIARQPEVAGKVNTAMIISAALIEGVAFFGLIICMLK